MAGECSIDGCEKVAVGQSLCSMHYSRASRAGELVLLKPGRGIHTFERGPVSDADRAYFAGYFDGEGCLSIARPSQGRRTSRLVHWPARVEFKQTQEHVVLELHRLYGGSIRVEWAEHGRWKPSVKWGVSRTEAVFCFLRDIHPFVREKRAQVEAVLERYQAKMWDDDGEALYNDLRAMKKRSLSIETVEAHMGSVVKVHDLRVSIKEK